MAVTYGTQESSPQKAQMLAPSKRCVMTITTIRGVFSKCQLKMSPGELSLAAENVGALKHCFVAELDVVIGTAHVKWSNAKIVNFTLWLFYLHG